MDSVTFGYIQGLGSFFWLNLKHYAWALWGIRLRIDPDYPIETRFHGHLIVDAVLEYRFYALFAPWCVFLALVMPWYVRSFLVGFWGILAWKRAAFYKTRFVFWRQAYKESPKKPRVMVRYAEEIMREIERLDKAGVPWDSEELQQLISEGKKIQRIILMDGIIAQVKSQKFDSC